VIGLLLLSLPPLEGSALATPELVHARHQHLGLRWFRPLVRTGFDRSVVESFGTPALVPDRGLVVVPQGEGTLLALDLDDGTERWRRVHPVGFDNGAVVLRGGEEDLVLATTQDGRLLAVELDTGQPRWEVALGSPSHAPIVAVDSDRVLVALADNRVALVHRQGRLLWSAGRSAPRGLHLAGQARATAYEGRVYAAYSDGFVECYHLETGHLEWRRLVSLGEGFLDVDADPVVAEGRLYVGSYSDGIAALDLAGNPLWDRPLQGVASLAWVDDTLLAGTADGVVWGLAADGSVRFRSTVGHGSISRFAPSDRRAACTTSDGNLVLLDTRTGEPLQADRFASRLGEAPVWVGAHLALFSGNGYLFAYEEGAAGLVQ
jgi:outer membrane protein assembly factor BamB